MKKVILILAIILVALPPVMVNARSLSDVREEIAAVNQKIRELNAEAERLAGEANTLSGRIAVINAQIAAINERIHLNGLERDRLAGEILATEKKIAANEEVIGAIVAEYYFARDVSTLERLFSGRDLSDFFNAEARLANIGESVSEVVRENKILKDELEEKKGEVERLIVQAESEKGEAERLRGEIATLLERTRGEEANYQALKKEQEGERARLEAEQRAILASQGGGVQAGDPNKGGYPWAGNCPAVTLQWWVDPWNMYVCQCVSYAAWKVEQYFGRSRAPTSFGNANEWAWRARARGIPVLNTPKIHTVAQTSAGPYGHVMWVEAISANGQQVYISEYNFVFGDYSERWVWASNFVYIDFGAW